MNNVFGLNEKDEGIMHAIGRLDRDTQREARAIAPLLRTLGSFGLKRIVDALHEVATSQKCTGYDVADVLSILHASEKGTVTLPAIPVIVEDHDGIETQDRGVFIRQGGDLAMYLLSHGMHYTVMTRQNIVGTWKSSADDIADAVKDAHLCIRDDGFADWTLFNKSGVTLLECEKVEEFINAIPKGWL